MIGGFASTKEAKMEARSKAPTDDATGREARSKAPTDGTTGREARSKVLALTAPAREEEEHAPLCRNAVPERV